MGDNGYAIISVDKINGKNRVELRMRNEHVNRKKLSANVDPERVRLDKTLVGEKNDDWYTLFLVRKGQVELERYKQKQKDNDETAERKMRDDAVIGLEIITTLSHRNYGNADGIDVDAWAKANVEWMQKHYGKDNVLHATLHMDEAAPHIHFFVTPVKDNRFSAREVVGNAQTFRDLHTEYADAMGEFGLKRGLNKKGRAPYVHIKQLYEDISNIPALPIYQGEPMDEYYERCNKAYQASYVQYQSSKKKLEVAKSDREYAHKLEEQLRQLQAQMQILQMELEHAKIKGLSVKDIETALDNYPNAEASKTILKTLTDLAEWGKEYDAMNRDELSQNDRV